MDSNKKKTVGSWAAELMQQESPSNDPIELQREMQQDYINNLIICIEDHKNSLHGDFFIVVLTKNETLMPNVFRNYFFATQACPTPTYDQSVFWYRRSDEELHYLWTVPSKDTCIHLRDNAHLVVPEEKPLLQFVLDFYDNTLFRLAKKLNKEEEKSPLIQKG